MEISVENTSNLERKIKVLIPAQDIDEKTIKKLEELKGKVKLAGFRPGKVPLGVVKQRFGNSARLEVIADTIRDSYIEALQKENLKPAGQPQIEPKESKFGEPLEYIATLEVLPEISLANMNDVKVEKLVAEVTDQDVEIVLQKLLKQNAEWNEVERGAQVGDQLIIDFEGKIKKETFKGGSGKDFKFELGAGTMLDDFEKPLKDVKAGETVEFKIKFPKDYTDSNVAGKKADFEVKVHKVLEPKLPELDDEFLAKVGIEEGGEQALRAELSKNMRHQLEHEIPAKFKNKLIDKLLELNPIELPKVLIDSEIRHLQNLTKQQYERITGVSSKDLPEFPREQYEKTAKRRVSFGLLSGKIIEEQNIKADPEQVRAKITDLAAGYENPDEIIKWYYQNEERLLEIESLVLEEKVVEQLQKQVKVVEKKVSYDELINSSKEKS